MRALLCAVAVLVGSGALGSDKAPRADDSGRYTIVNVSGGSGWSHIYLLDTVTGRTWITCSERNAQGEKIGTMWCPVQQGPGEVWTPPKNQ